MARPKSNRLLFVCLLGLAPATLPADTLTGWDLSGYNALRLENYGASGDPASRPYPELGFQYHDDFRAALSRRLSAYERMQVELAGTLNRSDYRSPEKGLVLERARWFWEKGDAGVPFRLEAGEFFAYQSFRTIQRGLKGAQLELQPALGRSGQLHSVQLFAGLTDPVYRDLDEDREIFSGGSWLLEDPGAGALSLSYVHGFREADAASGRSARHQNVTSLAWNKGFELGPQDLDVDAEYAYFSGEHAGAGAGATGEAGLYAQLTGRSRAQPLSYRLRYEDYGADFRPAGAPVSADHRRVEAHGAWTFDSGRQLRGRLQSFRDGQDSANPLDTDLAGLTLSGTLIPERRVSGSVDAFIQHREDRAGTVDGLTRSLNAALSAPIRPALRARGGVLWTGTDDRTAGSQHIVRQISLSLDRDFALGRYSGTVSPGLVLRRGTGGNQARDDVSPSLALILSGGPHSLRLAYNVLRADAHAPGSTDSLTQHSALGYTYTRGRHRFGLDANWFGRNPDPGRSSEAYRLSAYWSVSFDRPAAPVPAPVATASLAAESAGPPRLSELAPGASLADVRARLARAGIMTPSEAPGLLVYEARLLDGIDRRQRLGLVHTAGHLDAAVLVVDLSAANDPDSAAQSFERVREILYRRYGTPDLRIEEGGFGPTLAADLASGRFRRILEWRTPRGRLRFGIPYRVDGELRMEIIHARGFAPAERDDWGVEALR